MKTRQLFKYYVNGQQKTFLLMPMDAEGFKKRVEQGFTVRKAFEYETNLDMREVGKIIFNQLVFDDNLNVKNTIVIKG